MEALDFFDHTGFEALVEAEVDFLVEGRLICGNAEPKGVVF